MHISPPASAGSKKSTGGVRFLQVRENRNHPRVLLLLQMEKTAFDYPPSCSAAPLGSLVAALASAKRSAAGHGCAIQGSAKLLPAAAEKSSGGSASVTAAAQAAQAAPQLVSPTPTQPSGGRLSVGGLHPGPPRDRLHRVVLLRHLRLEPLRRCSAARPVVSDCSDGNGAGSFSFRRTLGVASHLILLLERWRRFPSLYSLRCTG